MEKTLKLSRAQLQAFLECKRRFELRTLTHLPWPPAPLVEPQATAVSRGQQFHRLLERHFLGMQIDSQSIDDPDLRRWWFAFRESDLRLPDGRFLPEHRLTIPAGNHFLTGRFDLLILGEEAGLPCACIYDWKTSRPRQPADLRADWQTRLYLAMLAESGEALLGSGRSLHPNQITLIYWYVDEPDQPRELSYNQAQHAQNWSQILALLAEIDAQITAGEWPLTDDWEQCRNCIYQTYCGRQSSKPVNQLFEEDDFYETELFLEPESP